MIYLQWVYFNLTSHNPDHYNAEARLTTLTEKGTERKQGEEGQVWSDSTFP